MKLTSENLDSSDCRPGPSNYPKEDIEAITPDYINALILKRAEARRAALDQKPRQNREGQS